MPDMIKALLPENWETLKPDEKLSLIPQFLADPPKEWLGKLPKPTRADNNDGKCSYCNGWHGLPAVHLDYLGHADLQIILIMLDPRYDLQWKKGEDGWMDMRRRPAGSPKGKDRFVLEGDLTLLGLSRPGVGTVEVQKQDPEKEIIGDLLRNCLPAGTLVATADGDKAIEHVQPGDQVFTRSGLRAVTAASLTHSAMPVLHWRLSDGTVLAGTADHLVLRADEQWARIEDLRNGDIIFGWHDLHAAMSVTSTWTGSTSTATPARTTFTGQSTAPRRRSIDTSISAMSDRSRRGTTFTTTTETLSTTIPATSSPSPDGPISVIIDTDPQRTAVGAVSHLSEARHGVSGVRRLARKLLGVTREWIASSVPAKHAATRSLSSVSHSLAHADKVPASLTSKATPSAAKNANPKSLPTDLGRDGVPSDVNRLRIVAFIGMTIEPVYDLTVDTDHEFMAGSFMAHNCAQHFGIATALWSKLERWGNSNDTGYVDERGNIGRPSGGARGGPRQDQPQGRRPEDELPPPPEEHPTRTTRTTQQQRPQTNQTPPSGAHQEVVREDGTVSRPAIAPLQAKLDTLKMAIAMLPAEVQADLRKRASERNLDFEKLAGWDFDLIHKLELLVQSYLQSLKEQAKTA